MAKAVRVASVSRRVRDAAERAGFVGVLENEVERAFVAGRVRRTTYTGEPLPAPERLVDISNRPGGLLALVRQWGETPSGLQRFNVVDLVPRQDQPTEGMQR